MTVEKLKTAVANINAFLSESHNDDDTVTLSLNVIRSVKENYEELIEAKAEIERLEQEKGRFEADVEMFTDIGKMYSELKAEAVKEFAERLHEYINGIIEKHEMPMFPFSVAFVSGMETKIDNLVKEMVGDD